MVKNEIEKNSEIGKKAQWYKENNEKIPDDLYLYLLGKAIECTECERGFILDGFPTTISQ